MSFVNKFTAVSTHWWNQSGIAAWLCMLFLYLGITFSFFCILESRLLLLSPTETKLILCQQTCIMSPRLQWRPLLLSLSLSAFTVAGWQTQRLQCPCPLALKSSALPFGESGALCFSEPRKGSERNRSQIQCIF